MCGQLLSRSQEHDFPIWHHSSSRLYMVKSCYDMLLSLNGLPSTGFSEAWKRFWKLSLPPKVLDFVWRLSCNCFPLRVRQKNVWCWILVMVSATWKLRMHLIYFLIAHLLGTVG